MKRRDRPSEDVWQQGEAVIEFILLAVAILIPVAYFIMTLAKVEATVFAAEATARETARILSSNWDNTELADRQKERIFADYGIEELPQVSAVCQPQNCGEGAVVTVEVRAHVPYPLIPQMWAEMLVPQIPIEVTAVRPIVQVQLVE